MVRQAPTTAPSSSPSILAEAHGLKVRGVMAIIDRLECGRETLSARGYSLETLLTIRDFGLGPTGQA